MRRIAEPVARTSASRYAESSAELSTTFATGALIAQSRIARRDQRETEQRPHFAGGVGREGLVRGVHGRRRSLLAA